MSEHRSEFIIQSPTTCRVVAQGPTTKIDRGAMVSKVIKTMKTGRASGPKRIPAELLKCESDKLKDVLSILFEKCVNGDKIPEEWTMAWVTSIYRKGRKDKCDNYRCISITSLLRRLCGKIIRNIIKVEYV